MMKNLIVLPIFAIFFILVLFWNYENETIQIRDFRTKNLLWVTDFNRAKPNRTRHLILDWTSFFGSKGQNIWEESESYCPWNRCDVTNNRNLVDEAEAIYFHIRDLNWDHIPKERYPWQRYVFIILESPMNTLKDLKYGNKFFNLTMTYRRDSDIYIPYGKVSHGPTGIKLPVIEKIAANKSKLAATFVSNCQTDSKREIYLKELKKHASIDVYGACGDKECSRNHAAECNNMLKWEYKFYLSLENSVCPDYITEKFYARLEDYVVPVVFKDSDYLQFLAPQNSYLAANNFTSPKDLADYLMFLDKNQTTYLKYLEWHTRAKVIKKHALVRGLCDLCEILMRNDKVPSVYEDIHEWWHILKPCDHDFGLKLLKNR